MALQWQAGVLTEEVVLAVQGLVEVSVLNDKPPCCSCIFYILPALACMCVCRSLVGYVVVCEDVFLLAG